VPYGPTSAIKKVVSSHKGTKGTKVFLGGRAGRKSQVAGRESTTLIATTQWLAILRVKALLCFLNRQDARNAKGLGRALLSFLAAENVKIAKVFGGMHRLL